MGLRNLLLAGILFAGAPVALGNSILEAVKHPSRPNADVKRDADRKPQAVLSFFDVKPGIKVLDVYSTGGYYTELLSRIVGDKGTVYAHNSKAYRKFMGQSIDNRYVGGRLPNVEKIYAHPREIELPGDTMDMVLMILIFHDLYVTNAKNLITTPDRKNLLEQVYKTLKMGGTLGIVDHSAPRGTGVESATEWHRMASSVVVEELKKFGFELVSEDTTLRNADDPLDISVFNAKIRGKTDRYILKFKKVPRTPLS